MFLSSGPARQCCFSWFLTGLSHRKGFKPSLLALTSPSITEGFKVSRKADTTKPPGFDVLKRRNSYVGFTTTVWIFFHIPKSNHVYRERKERSWIYPIFNHRLRGFRLPFSVDRSHLERWANASVVFQSPGKSNLISLHACILVYYPMIIIRFQTYKHFR